MNRFPLYCVAVVGVFTAVTVSSARAAVVSIASDAADVVLRSDEATPLDRTPDTIGAGGNPVTSRTAIFFFELPAGITSSADITAANLKVNLVANQDANTGHIKSWHGDLYGLGFQSDTTPDLSWWYHSNILDAAAGVGVATRTRIQDDYLDLDTPEGIVETDTDGDAALLAFVKAAYDAGAGPGDFLVIRINPDASYILAGAKGAYRIHHGGGTDLDVGGVNYGPKIPPVLELTTAAATIPAPAALPAGLTLLALVGLRRRRA